VNYFYRGLSVILIIVLMIILNYLLRSRLLAMVMRPVSIQSFALGTLIQITAYGRNAKKAVDEAVRMLGALDDQMSYYKKDSDVTQINRNAGLEPQIVGLATYAVIKKAVYYSKLSDGAIDLTVRPLINLWGIGGKDAKIPTEPEIKKALALVNYQNIEWNDGSRSIRLTRPHQCLDLNCIAKGFATDEVKRILKQYQIKKALINLGGNIYAHGAKPDGSPWQIGIQHPFKPRGNYLGYLSLTDRSVVTSGGYEKFFSIVGHQYHHIIDPKTGYPVDNGIISTTVISKHSIDGDALTTCLYVMGVTSGLKLIESLPDVAAIIITEERRIYGNKQIRDQFILTDNEYRWERSV
jgi:FAD:protein FMN transferase